MKRAPYTYGVHNNPEKRYWRSLEEFADTPAFRDALDREFPEGASEMSADESGTSRRSFLQLMGASAALAGLAGCQRPEEKILPYAKAPEQVIPGKAQYYATAFPFLGTSFGLLVESHEGRPTKIEGNPRHPDSLGAANVWAQGEILALYDPDRSGSPAAKGQKKGWEEAVSALRARVTALKAAGGKGFAVLTPEHRSPSLESQLAALRKELPGATVVRYEPVTRQPARDGAKIAFGRPFEAVLETEKAEIIAAFDSDFVHSEGSAIKAARGFADGRRLEGERAEEMNRLYSVESGFSPTGTAADHRLRVQSRDVGHVLMALVGQLAASGVDFFGVDIAAFVPKRKPNVPKIDKFVAALAKDLAAHRGQSLVVVGHKQPAEIHAVGYAINAALGNLGEGKPMRLVRPFAADDAAQGPAAVKALADQMRAGAVDTLLILGGNPVLDAPADADFAGALAKVPFSAHLGSHAGDETSSATTWHLPRAHFLEAWGDTRAEDGTLSIVQPLIAPLLDGKSDIEVVELALGGMRKGYEIVRTVTAAEHPASVFETVWRRALHDGIWEGSAYAVENTPIKIGEVGAAAKNWNSETGAYEVTFGPDAHAWDGRYANNGWLQEMPDPMTKLTWDNAALVGPKTAEKLGVVEGDMVRIAVKGAKTIELPIRVAPGTADDTVAVTFGQGRRKSGRVGEASGFDAYPARTVAGWGFATASVEKTGGKYELAQTQEHYYQEGRPIVREADLTRFKDKKKFEQVMENHHPPLLSLFNPHPYDGHRWGMAIDLNACIGCNACMVACQSENNIPLVGKKGVQKSREMHWIRIDRYFTGDDVNDPQAVTQPLGCQQCENAPCEQVCPVGATTHSPEGLNDMAYNRCIGTRYCANNCPYKVRRFNFFNYQKNFEIISDLRKMQFNPDVTVRARGVMEKCTYCVQRINEAKIHVQQLGRDRVKDGEVVTACMQTCPTKAIVFGDLNDKGARVTALTWSERSYRVLDDLNVRPRTSFLARVRNLNPELA